MKNKLKVVREASGKTQHQTAIDAGMTESMYQRYEYGQRKPNVYTAIRIARALQSTVEELFSLSE